MSIQKAKRWYPNSLIVKTPIPLVIKYRKVARLDYEHELFIQMGNEIHKGGMYTIWITSMRANFRRKKGGMVKMIESLNPILQ